MCFLCRADPLVCAGPPGPAKAAIMLVLALFAASAAAPAGTLRVCADPNNLPYSDERREGFENKLAELLAHDLDARVEYTWWSERKSFLKNSLLAGKCDVVMGVPSTLDSVAVTRPYYRSTYVFVSRRDRNLAITSLMDPRLEKLRIGIHVVGDDYAPPAVALGRRGLAANITGYSLFGRYGEQNPPARLIDAVSSGEVDVAIVWGPFAGYFAPLQKTALEIAPVSPAMYLAVPFTYDISVAVRPSDTALRTALDAALARQCSAVASLLAQYGVPRIASEEGKGPCESPRQSSAASSR
jgi:mxaJ protein